MDKDTKPDLSISEGQSSYQVWFMPTDKHPDNKPRVDEIIVDHLSSVHYEQLDHRAGWMRIGLKDESSI
jgi:hypothetical protein